MAGTHSRDAHDEAHERLGTALAAMLRHPVRSLLVSWSWKSAAISACLRAGTFFATNLRAGHGEALRAGAVEAVFAVFAAGVMGAVAQRVRRAEPMWATALFVWCAMPSLMLAAQLTVHTLAGTPHMKAGLIASFCFAALASSFSWYAMREGVLLSGAVQTSLAHDARQLPRIVLGYIRFVILFVPRALFTPANKTHEAS